MKKKIERRVAEEITQQPIKIAAGGRTFIVPRPTIGTLIMLSAEISELPKFDIANINDDEIIGIVLENAKHCNKIGDALAVCILGAKAIKEEEQRQGLFRWKRRTQKDMLSRWLIDNLSTAELTKILSTILQAMEVGDFFGLITFLGGSNMTRPTKVN